MLKLEEEGQALIEFIFFVPFLITLYTLLLTISGSFNSSINQQKAARLYFFYTIQNDSMTPYINTAEGEFASMSLVSMRIMGWANEFDSGDIPVANCFKLNLPTGEIPGDSCEEKPEDETHYIRIQTVFGICGASYINAGDAFYPSPLALGEAGAAVSCTIAQ